MLASQSHAAAIANDSDRPDFTMEADVRDRVLSARSGLIFNRRKADDPLPCTPKAAVGKGWIRRSRASRA
jgi:hypothetical protein